jgi:hypothetical protein
VYSNKEKGHSHFPYDKETIVAPLRRDHYKDLCNDWWTQARNRWINDKLISTDERLRGKVESYTIDDTSPCRVEMEIQLQVNSHITKKRQESDNDIGFALAPALPQHQYKYMSLITRILTTRDFITTICSISGFTYDWTVIRIYYSVHF